jgi:hypothetical protein
MSTGSAVVVTASLPFFVGSSIVSTTTKGTVASPATVGPAAPVELDCAQVRAEWIFTDANDDFTTTKCTIVNRSQSKTLDLGDVLALGPDGLAEESRTDRPIDGHPVTR